MRTVLSLLLSIALLAPAAEVSFRRDKPGTVPKDWVVAMTHEGGAPKWEIVEDPSASPPSRVLAQTSNDKTSGRFPLAIYQKAAFTDGAVSVRFKPVAVASIIPGRLHSFFPLLCSSCSDCRRIA